MFRTFEAKPRPCMDRDKYILAVMSVSKGQEYTPVQLQKLFFLLDENISDEFGGQFFNFEPYHYGPFDKDVYTELEALKSNKLLDIHFGFNNLKKYKLSEEGQKKGEELFGKLSERSKNYIKKVEHFVITLSFDQLIRSIYAEYPKMKAKSIFSS